MTKLSEPDREKLYQIALHYLSKFPASRKMTSRVLERRFGWGDSRRFSLVSETLDRLQSEGHIDDQHYAQSRMRSLIGRGTCLYVIEQRLRAAGISRDLCAQTRHNIAESTESETRQLEALAAWCYARKKGLGPWHRDENPPPAETRAKAMKQMIRRGFAYDLAGEICEAETVPTHIEQALAKL